MSEFKIENGIPMPASKSGINTITSCLRQLEPGDSVFVTDIHATKLSAFASNATRGNTKKFSCRTLVEKGVKGVRVWRIE